MNSHFLGFIFGVLYFIIMIVVIVGSLYALIMTFSFAIENLTITQSDKTNNEDEKLSSNESIAYHKYFLSKNNKFNAKHFTLYLFGCIYALITHILIFLATCTSSHHGGVDLLERPSYSIYGVSFANLYYDYAFNMICIMAGCMFIATISSYKYILIRKWFEQIFYSYQVAFVILFFVPAGIFGLIFSIEIFADSVFNHFIEIKEIKNSNQYLVYELKKDIVNPRLGQTSYF